MVSARNSNLLRKVTVFFVICFFTLPAQGKYGGGTGEPNDPYLIYDANHMQAIGADSNDWDKCLKLMADIDLSAFTGTSFNIIGYWSSSIDNKPFSGTFDGNGHTISNFTYTSTDRNGVAIFGYVNDPNAEIKNLGLIAPNIDVGTMYYVGSLVGRLINGTITACYAEGGSVSGKYTVGGLVGRNGGTITNCYSEADVSGSEGVGGLVGMNNHGTITNCYATGTAMGDWHVGGLAGTNHHGTITNCNATGSVAGYRYVGGLVGVNGGTIKNCYSEAVVLGTYDVGGLVGYNWEYIFTHGTITNSYATGSVEGQERVGGLVGWNDFGTISNCYSAGSVLGNDFVGGLVGYDNSGSYTKSFWDNTVNSGLPDIGNTSDPNVRGESTANMQTQNTFTDASWDFMGEAFNGIEDIWFIPQQDYPHLWWEGMQVSMKLTPRTLNCRSYGNWVKAHLTLPQGFTVADVTSDRPAVLHSFGFESAPLYVFINKDKLVQIEAAFEREAVCSLAGDWPQALTVAGFLADGNIFLGTSTVRIIHPGMKEIE